ncbi:12732_t:CDS:2, partial [Entrophospora sp. SA101]
QRLGDGINNSPGGSGVVNRLSIKGAAGNQQARYSIKGEGGPATITVNNLAPGTSANDIKVAFMEFGEISTMNVDERFPANPVKAELTFESKVSVLDAIKKYNTALVDGYVLKVQLKQPGNNSNTGAATYRARGKLNKPPVRANGKLHSDQLLSGQKNKRMAGSNKRK